MAKRDNNGPGQPHKRDVNGKETWQVVKVVTMKWLVSAPNGQGMVEVKQKKKLTGTGATQALAKQRLDENYKKHLVLTGEAPQTVLAQSNAEVRTTVREMVDTLLERKQGDPRTGQSTIDLYRRQADQHVIPALGDTPIRLISKADMNRFIRQTLPAKRKQRKNPRTGRWELTDEPLLSSSPIRSIYSLLNMAFEEAVADGLIGANPMTGVPAPPKKGVDPHRASEIIEHHYIPRRITDALWGTPELGRWILTFLGLRASERLGIETTSFRYLTDPKRKTELIINRQLLRKKDGTYYIKPQTKTTAGNRVLVLPDEVTKHLLLWKKQRDEWRKSGDWHPEPGLENLFFTQANGQHIRHNKDRLAWSRLLVELKLPHHRLHDMRHMTATELGRAGIHPEIAKLVVGHSQALMTAYYQHFDKASTSQPLDVLAGQFTKDVKNTKPTPDAGDVLASVSVVSDSGNQVEKLDAPAVPGLTDALGITDPTETPDA